MKKIRQWLRSVAWWILVNIHPAEDELDTAIKGAFTDCGLPVASYHLDFDLLHSGKFHEVLVHASARIGNQLVTVNDLKQLLS